MTTPTPEQIRELEAKIAEKVIGWQDTSKHMPKADTLYFISDGKNLALARWSIPNMWWNFLWHTQVFTAKYMLEVKLPLLPVQALPEIVKLIKENQK